MSLGAALVDSKVAARLLASPSSGWPTTPGKFLDAMRVASERHGLRAWMWEWLRRQGVEIPAEARLIDGILDAIESFAQRERNVTMARDISLRARVMPDAEFGAWLDGLRQPRTVAGKVGGA